MRTAQLHNLTSEDEQSEFQRRFTRDLRSRGVASGRYREESTDENEVDDLIEDQIQAEKEEKKAAKRPTRSRRDLTRDQDDDQPEKEVSPKKQSPLVATAAADRPRRSTRSANSSLVEENGLDNGHTASDEHSEDEEEAEQLPTSRSTRSLRGRGRVFENGVAEEEEDDEDAAEPMEETEGERRRSTRLRGQPEKKLVDEDGEDDEDESSEESSSEEEEEVPVGKKKPSCFSFVLANAVILLKGKMILRKDLFV